MQSNIILLSKNQIITEEKLHRMNNLEVDIKILQAEYNMLKKEVISEYFFNHEEYRTPKGLLLATYKSYVESRFNNKKFEEDHPDYYEMYKQKKIIFKFDLK